MLINKLFHEIGKRFKQNEGKLISKNRSIGYLARKKLLRPIEVILFLVVMIGIGFLISRVDFHRTWNKIAINADVGGSSVFDGHIHFHTVINGASLNEYATPQNETDWTFEKDHLDTVIGSYHAKGLYDRNRADTIKTHQIKYTLMFSTDGYLAFNKDVNPFNAMIFSDYDSSDPITINKATYKNMQETKDMHDFCTGTGNMPDGYSRPNLSEAQFEDAFVHFSDDTIVNAKYVVPNSDPNTSMRGQEIMKPLSIKGFGNGTATERSESRVLHNGKYGYFYILNPKSDCARKWKSYESYVIVNDPQPAKYSDGTDNTTDPGVIYDGVFVDEANPGSIIIMNNTISGGHIAEYGNQTRDEIDTDFSTDQGGFFTSIKSDVSNKIGHDFLLTLNSAQANYTDDPVHAAAATAAGGITTEMYSTEQQYDGMGREYYNFRWANYANQHGLYFAWSQMEPDSQLGGDPTYTASNYTGATGGIKLVGWQQVGPDPTGKEARHDMQSLVSYLIIKDRSNRMVYAQRAWGNDSWDLPLSSWWMKAREMDIGQPTTDQYTTPVTANDVNGQSYIFFRRDYDHGIALERGYAGYPYTTDFGVQSQSYEIDPVGHTAYRIIYPDGNLSSSTHTSITLAAGEGVVLIPDGYDPMTGGTVNPPSTTNAKITLTTGGVRNVGDTFYLTANLNPNDNKVCAATVNLNFPASQIAVSAINPGSLFNQRVESIINNTAGTITYTNGAPGCATTNTDLFTIEFRAIGPGSGNIDFGNVEVVGGESTTNMVPIVTDLLGTTITVSGTPPVTVPETTLEITNGATVNSNGYYNVYPVIKLTAAVSGGATISNIKYKWDTGDVQTIPGSVASNITINTDGDHTLIYYATDSNSNVEPPKTANFKIDTAPKDKPIVDPYHQHTYKPTLNLKGTKTSDINKILINDSDADVTIVGNNWSKIVNLPLDTDPGTGRKIAQTTTFIVTGEDVASNRNSADPVEVTRHLFADIDGDGFVGTLDFTGIMGNWHNILYYMADFDDNNTCDLYDFGILVANWNQP